MKYHLKCELEKIKNTESQLRQEMFVNKAYGAISELDDTLMILKYF